MGKVTKLDGLCPGQAYPAERTSRREPGGRNEEDGFDGVFFGNKILAHLVQPSVIQKFWSVFPSRLSSEVKGLEPNRGYLIVERGAPLVFGCIV